MGIHKQFRKASSWVVALAVAGLGSGLAVGATDIYLSLTNPADKQFKFIVTRVDGQSVPIGGNPPNGVGHDDVETAYYLDYYQYVLVRNWYRSVSRGVWLNSVPPLDYGISVEAFGTLVGSSVDDFVLFLEFIGPGAAGGIGVEVNLFKNAMARDKSDGWVKGDFVTVEGMDDFNSTLTSWYEIFRDGCYPIGDFDDLTTSEYVTLFLGDQCGLAMMRASNYAFSAPHPPRVFTASKGSKNSVSLGNSGFAPVGNGMMIGVGYDRADNSVSNSNDANFDGNEYRIHLDLLKGHNNLFYGLAGEYREGKYTLADLTTKYKTKYYGPRVDLGYRGMASWAQLSGGYYFGNAYVDDDKGSNGYLAQLGLLAQMDKQLGHRLTLEPGVDVQYIWQKLGTIDGDKFKNRDYGRADFNLGLAVALVRGWDITPNVGYRWDIKSACTQEQGFTTKICEPNASGVRYGVQLAKAVMMTGSKWDELAVSAYWDYFKKSGVKQNVWGVMAQYPF